MAVQAPTAVPPRRFEIVPHRRELRVDGAPVRIGGRAFDILQLLLEAGGGLVTKDEIMRRVWPGTAVEENNLQVHISALRKALGGDGALIKTISGRGYRLVAADAIGPASGAAGDQPATRQATNLPSPTSELIGRDAASDVVVGLLAAHRLVTLTGAGGIGKTRLGVAVAHRALPDFADGVWLVELAQVSTGDLVPHAVAAALGLEFAGGTPSPDRVSRALRAKRLLLVLDNCERVIDAAAHMADVAIRAGADVRVLATSREPLRVEAESVYRVPPLDVPAADSDPQEALRHSAVQLFATRALAAEPDFTPDARAAALMGAVCRRLDGIPLAIELAAARVATLGLEDLAARLDDRFDLLTGGHRTALPRHQTLRATLDWSYDLLLETDRVVLRRLAVFVGSFTIDSAIAVAGGADLDAIQVVDAVANLVAKSLVAAIVSGTATRFRMLEMTRAYALGKLKDMGEHDALARRHAGHCRAFLERARADWDTYPLAEWLAAYRREMDDVRAALDWAFAHDVAAGVALSAIAVPLMYELSSIAESFRRAEIAVAALAREPVQDRRHELPLRAVMGAALLYARGPTPETVAAWQAAFDIAARLDDFDYQARSLWGLWTAHIYAGAPRAALDYAQRFCELAATRGDAAKGYLGLRITGIALHYLGFHARAREHIERMLAHYDQAIHRWRTLGTQVEHSIVARATLARVLWVQGHADQAVHVADSAVAEAEAYGHGMTLCYVLVEGAVPVALMVGDVDRAAALAARLLEQSDRHGLVIWHICGRSFRETLQMQSGDLASGIERMRVIIDELRETGFNGEMASMLMSLAKGLALAGQLGDAAAVIDEALAQSAQRQEHWCLPELLRTKGEIVLKSGDPRAAEAIFVRALGIARDQGALAWELRAAMSVARLRRGEGAAEDARAQLAPVYARFAEGFATEDLRAARALLEDRLG